MRQAGIIAAAGIYALEHQIERLAEDHENAKRLARGIAGAPGIGVDPAVVETNIVRFDVDFPGLTSYEFADRLLKEEGIRVSVPSPSSIRVVPHLGITQSDVDLAVASISSLAGRLTEKK
jgi:threonine aldolase